jgi:hypothetical protein
VTTESADRRHARRVLFPCEVHAFGVGERLIDPHIVDLSLTGAFVATQSELPVGEVVILKFRADESDLKLESEVAHVEPQRGLGLRFLRLTAAQETALTRALEAAEEDR